MVNKVYGRIQSTGIFAFGNSCCTRYKGRETLPFLSSFLISALTPLTVLCIVMFKLGTKSAKRTNPKNKLPATRFWAVFFRQLLVKGSWILYTRWAKNLRRFIVIKPAHSIDRVSLEYTCPFNKIKILISRMLITR